MFAVLATDRLSKLGKVFLLLENYDRKILYTVPSTVPKLHMSFVFVPSKLRFHKIVLKNSP